MNTKQFLPLAFVLALTACQTAEPITDTNTDPVPVVIEVESSSSEMNEAQVSSDSMAEQYIRFEGKSTLVNHPGTFEEFTATYEPGATDAFADGTISVMIDLNSVTSDSDGLTGHLKRDDFFDTETYPTAEFTSTEIVPQEDDSMYLITGDLTMKGVTRSVTGTGVYANNMLNVNFLVPRAEFGIGNDSYGEKLLADEIPVEAQISL